MEFAQTWGVLLLKVSLMLFACIQGCYGQEEVSATCAVTVNSHLASGIKDTVTGTVSLKKVAAGTELTLVLSGFDKTDAYKKHGFHIHTSANRTVGCNSMGGHYNPGGVDHGAPVDAVRHVGDLGNIEEDANGEVKHIITDRMVSLVGTETVIGRSIVIHQKEDDLGKGGDAGSKKTGNAGSRISCCVIVKNQPKNSANSKVPSSVGLLLLSTWLVLRFV